MKLPRPSSFSVTEQRCLRMRLIAWYRRHKRPMPWRNTTDPYAIWLSEVMLQQTQVATVEPYYHRFLQRFTDINTLAAAPLEEVLKLWAGLGYYRRAKSLHRAAQIVASTYHGIFPSTYNDILELPGIGRYTAGAIASIAFSQRVPVLDGNVMRVLTRLFAMHGDIAETQTQKQLWHIAETLVPDKAPGDFNQAMMELGATLCTPAHPRCDLCPLQQICIARREHLQDRLPIKKRKAAAARIQLAAVIIESPRGRLLGRRKSGGLWEHLWEYPAFELSRPTTAAISRRLFALSGLRIKLKRQPAAVRHQLTHRRMEYIIFSGRTTAAAAIKLNTEIASDYDALRWVTDMKDVPVARITGKISALATPDDPADRI